MWNANPLQAERLSFIHCGSSTQGGSSLLFLTPNPRCGDVECQPPAGREIVVYTLWLEYTRGQFTLFLTPNPRCGDVECQPPAGREIVVYTLWLEYTRGQFTFS